jgi:hypothetical protein
MISAKLAKEIANKMDTLAVAEDCLKKLDKIDEVSISFKVSKGFFQDTIKITDSHAEVRQIMETIIKRHKECLETLNRAAVREAQEPGEHKETEFPDLSDSEMSDPPKHQTGRSENG